MGRLVGLFTTILEGTSPAVKFEIRKIKPYILIQLQIAIVSITEVLTLSFSLTVKDKDKWSPIKYFSCFFL